MMVNCVLLLHIQRVSIWIFLSFENHLRIQSAQCQEVESVCKPMENTPNLVAKEAESVFSIRQLNTIPVPLLQWCFIIGPAATEISVKTVIRFNFIVYWIINMKVKPVCQLFMPKKENCQSREQDSPKEKPSATRKHRLSSYPWLVRANISLVKLL